MVELYKALGEYGVVMSVKCDNYYHMVQYRFEKGAIYLNFPHIYETACDLDRLEKMLIKDLLKFLDHYHNETIK